MRRYLATVLPLAAVGAFVLLTGGGGSGSAQAAITGSGAGNGATAKRLVTGPQQPVAKDDSKGFLISGSVDGLYPGKTAPLVLKVTNLQHFAIEVTSLTVSVSDAKLGCSAGNAAVTDFSGALIVPKKNSATATVQFTLFHSAPDACQGAVFPLKYSGEAIKP